VDVDDAFGFAVAARLFDLRAGAGLPGLLALLGFLDFDANDFRRSVVHSL